MVFPKVNLMKARLVPLCFEPRKDLKIKASLDHLRKLLLEEAEILASFPLGGSLPEAEAVLLPYLSTQIIEEGTKLRELNLPILILTTPFGTSMMWNWEIIRCLEEQGLEIYAPYNLEMTKKICRALGLQRELKETRFLIFEENALGDFVWGMAEFPQRLKERLGIQIIKQPQEVLAREMEKISDEEATRIWKAWALPADGVSLKEVIKSVKLYLCLRHLAEQEHAQGIGMPCWGEEPKVIEYTPACLAYTQLFKEKGILGVCEGDTLSLTTMFIIHRFFSLPVMISNIYPFLMEESVKRHERIDALPEVEHPEDCLLVAHCGYLGLIPREASTEFTVRPSVLDLFPEQRIAIDARLPEGEITLIKLHPFLHKIHIVKANIEGYAQFPGSDCRNGAVVSIKDGRTFAHTIYSHHYIIVPGHLGREDIHLLARILHLEMEEAASYKFKRENKEKRTCMKKVKPL